MEELRELYQACFPHLNAEKQLAALGENIKYEIINSVCFIIFIQVSPDEIEIIDIGTHPEHRKKGIAGKLLGKLLGQLQAKAIRAVYLEVSENNAAAIRLYSNAGFLPYSLRKNYYNIDGVMQNAILMKKSFDITA